MERVAYSFIVLLGIVLFPPQRDVFCVYLIISLILPI